MAKHDSSPESRTEFVRLYRAAVYEHDINLAKILVKDEVTRFAKAMTDALLKKYSDDDPEKEMVKEVTKSLIDQYVCASVEPLKNLENQLKDLFHIPAHVLLPKDEVQRNQYSAEDEKEVDDQIEELLNQIKKTKAFDVELRQELQLLRDFLPQVLKQLEQLEELDCRRQDREMNLQQLLPTIEAINDDMKHISIHSLEE